ncbi:MAG: hypothetical protein H6Q90_4839 [Deltaproteobacteria bacterium]|nr:hypothetical protein [Deltaproteobacteria bacterium]
MPTRWPLLVTLAVLACSACSTLTMRISRAELQADLASRFPVNVDKQVVSVRFSEPLLDMPGEPARLGLRLQLEANTAHSRLGGTVRVEGQIRYVESEHAFYLRDPKVTELRVDPIEASGPHESRLALLRSSLGSQVFADATRVAIEEALRVRPVYRLDAKRGAREAKAIRHLRSVRVDGHDLVLEVGL